ncbi:MAG: methyltransferase domain-containing protein [Chloroflexi bacterium]|nr:methyltransferase domain-containing protein [Chloroflexota bacterium]
MCCSEVVFENPFRIEDLMVFDDDTLQQMLTEGAYGLTCEKLALSVKGAPEPLLKRIKQNLSPCQRSLFTQTLNYPASPHEIECAHRRVLDRLFWELTYWKTPELYEELIEGEQLHPGIFESLEPDIRDKTVLDVGAGSGRASFECLRHGAAFVYAVEPSPGLLRILKRKLAHQPEEKRLIARVGRFDAIPLADSSVDCALSCSAFTAAPEQGGELGLAELRRVTRSSGKIVLIWPRMEDRVWLAAHGFHYVALPLQQEMYVHFRSLSSALYCAHRFYARHKTVMRYILAREQPEIPFSVLGVNPPLDYCWLEVKKEE